MLDFTETVCAIETALCVADTSVCVIKQTLRHKRLLLKDCSMILKYNDEDKLVHATLRVHPSVYARVRRDE